MVNKLNIGVVGAGIQGISNALFLQKKGFEVTLFDKSEPGSPVASYGNAGHFSPYASLSLNRTDVLADVPAMLMAGEFVLTKDAVKGLGNGDSKRGIEKAYSMMNQLENKANNYG